MCDAWLSLDYTVSNASVANLMLISFDRYMCVTRPLTYRVQRTPRHGVIMIALAWVISTLLWTPWIIGWPFIEVCFIYYNTLIFSPIFIIDSLTQCIVFARKQQLTFIQRLLVSVEGLDLKQ